MARHVLQYDRWDPKIGCFLRDPSILAPLEASEEGIRPDIADEAGLAWTDNRRLPSAGPANTGAAHRQQMLAPPQFSSPLVAGRSNNSSVMSQPAANSGLPTAVAVAVVPGGASSASSNIIYRADGSRV